MSKNHFILGTAGHVDHGKTALIKALTGIDCDTHPEEKLRGITINLGFAHIDFPNGTSIGIIDVPGHKDFVNTMISGACGIDMVMLVVAADSGIMPQTIEHIQISQMLGIKSGIVVLTKIDLVDEEMLIVIENEIQEFIKSTFLKEAPIFRVSPITGQGILELKNYLSQFSYCDLYKDEETNFRMFVDRIFSVAGFGTVVTGSVISGKLRKDENILLLPGGKELRVRRLERHGKEVNEVYAGNRAAINLTGIKKEDFRKGMVLSNKKIMPVTIVDAQIKSISSKKINLWSHAIFLCGTYESPARIHLIDSDTLKYSESAIAQVHLDYPFIAQKGDKFIIRSTSGDVTLGGGEIIDPYPLNHRRRTVKLITSLKNILNGGVAEIISAEVKKSQSPLTLESIINNQNIPAKQINNFSLEQLPSEVKYFKSTGTVFFILSSRLEYIKNKIIRNLENYHKHNPLDENGRTFEELMGIWGSARNIAAEEIMKSLLEEMAQNRMLKKSDSTWVLYLHNVVITGQDKQQIKFVERFHKESGMNVPLMSELNPTAHNFGITENKLIQILTLLTKHKRLIHIDDSYLHIDIVEKCREILLTYLKDHDEGITVAGFRDLLRGNRKICLLLFSIYDSEEIIYRDGDLRFITEKGLHKLQEIKISSKNKFQTNFQHV
ncbi:MAG: selenocysteine-specific translation elongation factor [Bacteroidota bacterium]